MDRDKPLLPLAEIDAWESRVVEIDELIRAQTAERAGLVRKIDAAKVFTETLPAEEKSLATNGVELACEPKAPEMEAVDESLAHEVLAAVGAMKGAPKPALIRRWINQNNPAAGDRLNAHPQYLYTALMRHVRAGRLAKRGNGYRLPISALKKGAGGVVTPSDDLNHFTPNDTRAAQTAPEAGGI